MPRGTIRQRGSDRWEVRVAAGWDPAAGRYHQVSRTVRGTKRDAEKVLTQIQAQIDQGGATRGGDVTVAELLVEWLDMIKDDRSPSTMLSHRSKAQLHLIPAIGRLKVRKLTTRHLDELYLDLTRKKHLAPATVRQVHAIIRRALHQAMRWGWIDRNPATLATLPAARRHPVRPPSPVAAMAMRRGARAPAASARYSRAARALQAKRSRASSVDFVSRVSRSPDARVTEDEKASKMCVAPAVRVAVAQAPWCTEKGNPWRRAKSRTALVTALCSSDRTSAV